MSHKYSFPLVVLAMLLLLPVASFGRGFGGGGRGGGGGRSFSGGGGGGGARNFSGGGGQRSYGGGGFSGTANYGGGARNYGGANFNRGGALPAQNIGGDRFSGGNFGGGDFAGRSLPAQNIGGDRFGGGNFSGSNFGGGNNFGGSGDAFRSSAAPNRGQLNSFLGLPSDEGLGGGNFDVNRGFAQGPNGGIAGGATVTGPGGNTVGRGGAVGPNGGAVAGRGFEGANGARGGQAIGVGPNGGVAGGAAVRGPNGYGGGRGFAAGANGVAAGYSRVTPSGRYTAAAAVRGNFNGYGMYGNGWYRNYPGAWFCAGWAANAAWNAATWDSVGAYMSYYPANPTYYDYGNNVTYQDNSVFIDGQDVGTAEQYYDQAAQLASTGAAAEAPSDGDWLPLGVFSLTKPDQPSANLVLQMAVNKDGIIRGNYTDTTSNQSQPIQGSVDKQTQRVAITVGSNKTTIIETGLYNLTKDEAPALMHYGSDRTEQWLLVRLTNKDAATK